MMSRETCKRRKSPLYLKEKSDMTNYICGMTLSLTHTHTLYNKEKSPVLPGSFNTQKLHGSICRIHGFFGLK